LLRDRARAQRSVAQDGIDVIEIRREFGAARARRGEVIPIVLEQRLL
jgi:hypothetical protein